MSVPATVLTGTRTDAAPPYVLALFRMVTGSLFTCHGLAGLFGLFGGPPGGSPGVGRWPGWWAALIQFAGGLLVLLGLRTRTAAVLCSGSMAYAYFTVHAGHALLPIQNGGEPAALFCWSFLLIAALGPGTWTLRTLTPTARRESARRAAAGTASVTTIAAPRNAE